MLVFILVSREFFPLSSFHIDIDVSIIWSLHRSCRARSVRGPGIGLRDLQPPRVQRLVTRTAVKNA